MEEHSLPSQQQLFAALIPPSPLPGLQAGSDSLGDPVVAESIRDSPSFADNSNWRRQLLTLHVIFPSLLLPALDLLDRGLVTRLLVAKELQNAPTEAAPAAASSLEDASIKNTVNEQLQGHAPDTSQAMDCKDQICMYTVQSAASITSRRKRRAPETTRLYAVHLDAWSCSCGGFALDAYSNCHVANNGQRPQSSPPSGWFGDLGLGRLTSLEDFPCCKHLLACLMAERWRQTPGDHVQDKYITKEELAAIIGGF